jgi:hypothetical protein
MSKALKGTDHALKQADLAARRGDLKEAERWSRTAERLAKAAERFAARATDEDEMSDEECRAELTRRPTKFAEADRDLANWQAEHAAYEANVFAAIANNTEPPPPLRPRPGAPLRGEDYLASIARGEV